jgi:hypothetical protein
VKLDAPRCGAGLLGIVADGDADVACSGQFAEVPAERGAPRPGHTAGQGAALGRDDVGDQHAPDAAGAANHPDPGLCHPGLPM